MVKHWQNYGAQPVASCTVRCILHNPRFESPSATDQLELGNIPSCLMFTALQRVRSNPWFFYDASMRADEVSSTGGWFWWWAFAGWTFPSFESLKCYHCITVYHVFSGLFFQCLPDFCPLTWKRSSLQIPRWIRSVERTSCRPWTSFVGLLGGGGQIAIVNHRQSSMHFPCYRCVFSRSSAILW